LRFFLYDTEEEIYIRKYIDDEYRVISQRPNLKEEELKLFEYLDDKTKIKDDSSTKDNLFESTFRDLILNRALSLRKTPYDTKFDFKNFDKFSCIEYVWYCYKCLFPFHRIRVKDFEFFNSINMPVIVPDVFVKNDFFKYIWSNIPRIENIPDDLKKSGSSKKKALKKMVKNFRKPFWPFVISVFLWNIIFLLCWYFISKI